MGRFHLAKKNQKLKLSVRLRCGPPQNIPLVFKAMVLSGIGAWRFRREMEKHIDAKVVKVLPNGIVLKTEYPVQTNGEWGPVFPGIYHFLCGKKLFVMKLKARGDRRNGYTTLEEYIAEDDFILDCPVQDNTGISLA